MLPLNWDKGKLYLLSFSIFSWQWRSAFLFPFFSSLVWTSHNLKKKTFPSSKQKKNCQEINYLISWQPQHHTIFYSFFSSTSHQNLLSHYFLFFSNSNIYTGNWTHTINYDIFYLKWSTMSKHLMNFITNSIYNT